MRESWRGRESGSGRLRWLWRSADCRLRARVWQRWIRGGSWRRHALLLPVSRVAGRDGWNRRLRVGRLCGRGRIGCRRIRIVLHRRRRGRRRSGLRQRPVRGGRGVGVACKKRRGQCTPRRADAGCVQTLAGVVVVRELLELAKLLRRLRCLLRLSVLPKLARRCAIPSVRLLIGLHPCIARRR